MDNLCPLCDTLAVSHPVGKKGELYHFCPTCDLVFKDPGLHVDSDRERERYLSHQNSLEDEGYVDMLSHFIETAIIPYTQGAEQVLDFGSGPNPVLAELLKQKGFATDIFDLHFAQEEDYLMKRYRVICLVEVLEHLKQPLVELEQLALQLEPGGILAIMTLFHPGSIEGFDLWWYRQDITHICFFSAETMSFLAHKLNLELIYIDQLNTTVFRKLF